MISLVDTNVLVYCHDPRSPAKRAIARELLRQGAADERLVLAHQTLVEFVSAVIRPRADLGGASLVNPETAHLQAEDLMRTFPILYPDESVLTTAIGGYRAYGLSWFDAHLWAYAEAFGIPEILSEDFEHGRYYGSVRACDPFLTASDEVHQLPPMYEEAARP
jgi:predicted nucleic acid-binding protein